MGAVLDSAARGAPPSSPPANPLPSNNCDNPQLGGVSTLATLSFFGWMHSNVQMRLVDDAVSKKEKAVLTGRVTSVTPAEAAGWHAARAAAGKLRVPQAPPKLPSGQVLLTARACPHHVRRKAKKARRKATRLLRFAVATRREGTRLPKMRGCQSPFFEL
jgi:hypothetical protein